MIGHIKVALAILATIIVVAILMTLPILTLCWIADNKDREEYLINEIEYDGHSYIVVEHPSNHTISAIHNPNCDCNNK